ncbi:MAG: hypothetical protein CME36_07420 [unclassified Hahellaceae]|nr:hypothetical protein [Hahellaceae bacterium]
MRQLVMLAASPGAQAPASQVTVSLGLDFKPITTTIHVKNTRVQAVPPGIFSTRLALVLAAI